MRRKEEGKGREREEKTSNKDQYFFFLFFLPFKDGTCKMPAGFHQYDPHLWD